MFYKHTITEELGEKRYGLKADALKNGTLNADTYFKNRVDGSSKGVVIMAFDFLEYQPDLQFETVSFMNMCIRNFTDFIPV